LTPATKVNTASQYLTKLAQAWILIFSFPGMCVWDPIYGVDGPHPYGQWGVYMPNEYVLETLSWMSANHGEFEVLFHPNTGYMVGGKLTLRMSTSTVTNTQ
jgi:hypothetical protein